MRAVILLFVMLLTAFPARAVDVCSCLPQTLAEDMRGAFAIFSGTVTGIRREFNPDRTRAEFDVHAVWTRVETEKYAVYTQGTDLVARAREGITCGFEFERGKSYLVYAWREFGQKGYPWVSKCGHTKFLEQAAGDIARLGKPVLVFNEPRELRVEQDFSPTPLPEVKPLPMIDPVSEEKPVETQDSAVPEDIFEQLWPEDAYDAVE